MLAAAVMSAAACGGKGGGAPADGGSDAGADAPADMGAGSCDPALQDCPAAEKCDFGCQNSAAVIQCIRSTDGGAPGDPCSSATPCARGTGCLTAPDAGAVCRKYCATDPECAAGERCHNVSVAISCGGTAAPLSLHYCY